MRFRGGLVATIIVFLLILVPVFSAVSVTITPAAPDDNNALTCLMDGKTTGFSAKWKGSGVTTQGIIANPLPASKTKIGKATCEAWVSVMGTPVMVGSAFVNIVAVNPCTGNNPPASNIPDQTINMNTALSINLLSYASDPNNNPLTFSVVNENTAQVDCSISGNTLTLTPAANYNGTASCAVRVTDSCNAFIDDALAITVNYVDTTKPIVTLIDTVTLDEDTTTTLDLNLYVFDVDNPDSNLTWTVTGNTNVQITIDPITHVATFVPAGNWSGSENITFTARDPAGNYGQDNVMVVVNPVNDAPWISPVIPGQNATEDSAPWSLDLKNYQHDVEPGPLTWSVSGVDASLLSVTIDANNNAIFTLVPNKFGTNTVTFTLKDAYGAGASQDVLITIGSLNHAPTIDTFSPILNLVMNEGSSQLFTITASDVDGNALNYSWLLDGVLVVGNITNTFNYSALNGPETHTLIANVSDGIASATITWTINVLNLPPTVTATADIVNESNATTVTATASDPGINDILRYSFDFNNDGSFEVQNSLSNISNYTWNDDGIYPVRIIVNDNNGGTASIIINAQVLDLAPNAVINATTNTTNEGSPLTFSGNLSTSSPDKIILYEWDWSYDGINFVAENTGINKSHIWMDNGTYVVGLRVTDDDGSQNIANTTVMINDLAPKADFIFSSMNNFTEPSIVSFIDNSFSYPDTIVSWSWDFNNDSIEDSNVRYPTFNFIQNGTYPVRLTVTDEDGSINSTTKNITIQDTHPVINSLSGPLNIIEGNTATFNSAVTSYDGLVNYQWNFNDGNITNTTTNNINHLFVQNGTYEVILTVFEADGDSTSSSWNIIVADTIPQPVIKVDSSFVNEGSPLQFYGSNSTAYDGIVLYEWNFSDGTAIDNSIDPVHTFARDGIYDVYLTLTDGDGSINTTRFTVGVIDINPIANFTFNPVNPLETDLVLFLDSSYTYDGIINWTWNFGDKNVTKGVQNPTHNYNSGNYIITLTVFEADGDSNSISKNIAVNDTKPIADFDYLPNPAYEWNNITFTSTSIVVHDPILSWLWNFGDGTTAIGNVTNHIYASNGTYNVSLTITDSDGSVDIYSELVVIENTPVQVSLTANPLTGNEPLNVTFTCTATGDAPFKYNFNFLIGSVTTNSSSFSVNTTYNNGTYNATCSVIDADGDTNTSSQLINVSDLAPQTAFYYTPSVPYENQIVSFFDNSTYVVDSIVSWFWNFGDNLNSTLQNPTHIYLQNGSYLVNLTIKDIDGSINSTSQNIFINDTLPTASIFAPISAVENSTVTFTGFGTGYDQPLNYSWNFGDGNTTIGQTLKHIYAQNGTYIVTLTVTDNDSSTAIAAQNITIFDTIPFTSFTFTPTNPMEGDIVNFTDNSSAYDGIASWKWDFESDGIIDNITQNPTHNFTSSGPYMITLTVTDSDGSSVNATRLIAVGDFKPIANFTFASPVTECSPVTLTSNSISRDGIANYTWNFGDGNTTITTAPFIIHDFKTISTPTQTFAVTLNITEADGDSSSITKNVIVDDTGVGAKISNPWNNAIFTEGSLVNFDGSTSTKGCDSIVLYQWNFGKTEGLGTGNITNHTYLKDGKYPITLTVVDSDGSQSIDSINITITNNVPSVFLTPTSVIGPVGTTTTFTCNVSGGDAPYTYSFDFGNGKINTTSPLNLSSMLFDITYNVPGVYTTNCSVTDADGDTNSTSGNVTIYDIKINELLADPSAPEPANEFVELYNLGINLNLSGWTIKDASSNTYSLTGIINAGRFKSFNDTVSLNNNGDTIYLYDSVGHLVDNYTYTSGDVDTDVSLGRMPDKTGAFVSNIPTPGMPNRLPQVPNLTLVSPNDGLTINMNNVSLIYNISGDTLDSLTCKIYTNTSSGIWSINATQKTQKNSQNSTSINGLSDGTYKWNVQCCDVLSNCNFAPNNYTFVISTGSPINVAPTISIISPLNKTYNITNILVNINAVDINLDSVWFNWNGINQTYTIGSPVPITFTDNSSITLTAYANDTLGLVNSTSVTFSVNTSFVPVNTAPYFDPTLINKTVQDGDSFNYDINATDSESNPINYSFVSGAPTGMTIDFNTGLVNWSIATPIGDYIIIVRICDNVPACTDGNFNLTVSPLPVNTPPTLLGIPNKNLIRNSGLNNNIIDLWDYANDTETPDNLLNFTILLKTNTSVVDCDIDSERYIDCTTQLNQVGSSDVTVQVTDQSGSTAQDTFTVSVTGGESTIINSWINENYYLNAFIYIPNIITSWVKDSNITKADIYVEKAKVEKSTIDYQASLVCPIPLTPQIINSIVNNSKLLNSEIINSTVKDNPDLTCTRIINSPGTVINTTSFASTIDSGSTVLNSNLNQVIVSNSILNNVIATGSTITNSQVYDVTLTNANINNNQICNGIITTVFGTFTFGVDFMVCTPLTAFADDDNDGILNLKDCSPLNKYIYPGNLNTFCGCPSNPITEICGNGIDENCDGSDTSCSSPGGGGGGGGSPGELTCTEKLFNCTDWNNCNPDGTMSRTCTMIKKCTLGTKPELTKSCTYYPKEEPKEEVIEPAECKNINDEGIGVKTIIIKDQEGNLIKQYDEECTMLPETPVGAATYNIGPLVFTKNELLYSGIGLGVILLLLITLGIYKLTRPKVIEHTILNTVAEEFVKKKKRK